MSTLRVGFVGLGAMGASMAGHLHRLGLLVAVSNRTHEKATRFAAERLGAAIAPVFSVDARQAAARDGA